MSRHKIPGATVVFGSNSVYYSPDQTMSQVVDEALAWLDRPDVEERLSEMMAQLGLRQGFSNIVHDSITIEFPKDKL